MPYLETRPGLLWHYEAQGQGPCLFFIHGWASSAKVFGQQIEYFSQEHTVVSVDLPGHGASGWQPLNMKQMAEDVFFLAQALGHPKISIVGSSMGGMIGLECARMSAGVEKLVMVGSLPRFLKTQQRPLGLTIQEMEKLKKQLKDRYPGILDIFFRSLFTLQEREHPKFRWIHQFRKANSAPDQQALEYFLDLLCQTDLTDSLTDIRVPILFLSGDKDYICPPESVDFLKNFMPKARYEIMPNSGHFPFIIYANEFNERVERFLQA